MPGPAQLACARSTIALAMSRTLRFSRIEAAARSGTPGRRNSRAWRSACPSPARSPVGCRGGPKVLILVLALIEAVVLRPAARRRKRGHRRTPCGIWAECRPRRWISFHAGSNGRAQACEAPRRSARPTARAGLRPGGRGRRPLPATGLPQQSRGLGGSGARATRQRHPSSSPRRGGAGEPPRLTVRRHLRGVKRPAPAGGGSRPGPRLPPKGGAANQLANRRRPGGGVSGAGRGETTAHAAEAAATPRGQGAGADPQAPRSTCGSARSPPT